MIVHQIKGDVESLGALHACAFEEDLFVGEYKTPRREEPFLIRPASLGPFGGWNNVVGCLKGGDKFVGADLEVGLVGSRCPIDTG